MINGIENNNLSKLTIQTAQTIDITASSGQSAVVSSTTKRIILTSTVDCWVALGSSPTATLATDTSIFLSAGIPSYPLAVTPSITKVAAIAVTSVGKLSILESL
jgi:hypothetical protein